MESLFDGLKREKYKPILGEFKSREDRRAILETPVPEFREDFLLP